MSDLKEPFARRVLNNLSTQIRRKLALQPSLRQLDPYLSAKELVFRAPPFTSELAETIKRLSPQFHLQPTERSRRFWELNQNGLCWGEFEALEPFLRTLPTPSRVLDIGPGLGRSAVFFKRVLGWQEVPFDLYESTGETTKYTRAGPRFSDSFCGNLEALEATLHFNEIGSFEIVDAAESGAKLTVFEGPYDFIYSFFAVGFHWSIEHFLDEILRLMHDRSLGAFTLHDSLEDFSSFSHLPHRVLRFRRSWPRGRWSRLLVLAKTEGALRTE